MLGFCKDFMDFMVGGDLDGASIEWIGLFPDVYVVLDCIKLR